MVLYKKDERDKCMHRIWDCKCPWVKARKLHGDAPIEVYIGDGSWAEVDWDEVATHHLSSLPLVSSLLMAMPKGTITACMPWNRYCCKRNCCKKRVEMRD